jgi:hypothetical protein
MRPLVFRHVRAISRGRRQMLRAREISAAMNRELVAHTKREVIGAVETVDGARPECRFFSLEFADVVAHIVQYLDPPERLALMRVCRGMRAAVLSPCLWRDVVFHSSWSRDATLGVARICAPHAKSIRIVGSADPHTCQTLMLVLHRLCRSGRTLPLRELVAEAPALSQRPPSVRRPHGRNVVDITDCLRILCANNAHLRVELGGSAPIWYAGHLDWYCIVGERLRLHALSDLETMPMSLEDTMLPKLVSEASRLVRQSGATTAYVRIKNWNAQQYGGEPVTRIADLLQAGVTDLRVHILPSSSFPMLALHRNQPYELRNLTITMASMRGAVAGAASTWIRRGLRTLRLSFENHQTNTHEFVEDVLHACADAQTLETVEVRGVGVQQLDDTDFFASDSAPEHVIISDYAPFVLHKLRALQFVIRLGRNVRRLTVAITDAGFELDDAVFCITASQPPIALDGGPIFDALREKNIQFSFVHV